ncbi:MAG TPA: hypothetical protein ENG70_00350 [Candidatus Cloacimonetes bacterium]|nr:hypothetical protein [Candidatus Cloacimonadota bacterium]HEX37307.1 hypothetical protein [Candidatus Cloacimonadota bacterium]
MKPFEVLASGYFPLHKLRVIPVKRTLIFDREVEALIESHWKEEMKKAQHKNKLLYNGPIYRLEDYNIEEDILEVFVSNTNFKELMGTNFFHPELAEKYGKAALSNAIALSTFLQSSNGKFIFVKRSENIYFGEGLWHLIAGQFSIESSIKDEDSAFSVLEKELHEEAGITCEQIDECLCLGLIKDTCHYKPELVFFTKVSIPAKKIETMIEHAHDDFEHEEVAVIPAGGLENFFKQYKFTSIAQGNYYLYKKVMQHG